VGTGWRVAFAIAIVWTGCRRAALLPRLRGAPTLDAIRAACLIAAAVNRAFCS
jgi:hypothetical protein